MSEITNYTKFKRKDLKDLSARQWDIKSEYDSLLLVPTGKKHDSGYHIIAIVGCEDAAIEIAAYCDDINWLTPSPKILAGSNYNSYHLPDLRMDMLYPSGIVHVWGRGKFEVGTSLSSVDITFRREDANNS